MLLVFQWASRLDGAKGLRLQARERTYHAALVDLLTGDIREAAKAWRSVLKKWPDDSFALKRAQVPQEDAKKVL